MSASWRLQSRKKRCTEGHDGRKEICSEHGRAKCLPRSSLSNAGSSSGDRPASARLRPIRGSVAVGSRVGRARRGRYPRSSGNPIPDRSSCPLWPSVQILFLTPTLRFVVAATPGCALRGLLLLERKGGHFLLPPSERRIQNAV
jgi:hypothetical protein